MGNYKSVSISVEAYQLTSENLATIIKWMGTGYSQHSVVGSSQLIFLPINTSQGSTTAQTNDWIIKNGDGVFSVCRPDSFKKFYTAA